jgi:hypothetical protein
MTAFPFIDDSTETGGEETLCEVYRRGRNIHEKGEGECYTVRRAKKKKTKTHEVMVENMNGEENTCKCREREGYSASRML